MKIYFGLHFDGLNPNPVPDAIGEKWLGSAGMLSLLQAQLGINSPNSSHTARVIEYLGQLQRKDHPKIFYHQSFQVDEFNVAEELEIIDTHFLTLWMNCRVKNVMQPYFEMRVA